MRICKAFHCFFSNLKENRNKKNKNKKNRRTTGCGQRRCPGAFLPDPMPRPSSWGAAGVCNHPSWAPLASLYLHLLGDKEHEENGIFHFRRMLEGSSVHSSDGSQPGPAHNGQTRDPGSPHARWPWKEDASRPRSWRHNGLAQGAPKQLAIKWFEGVLLGRCERLQV